jgi:hypothetical protein
MAGESVYSIGSLPMWRGEERRGEERKKQQQ